VSKRVSERPAIHGCQLAMPILGGVEIAHLPPKMLKIISSVSFKLYQITKLRAENNVKQNIKDTFDRK